jgi:peptide/nickel transport system substrate-binding protein
MVKGVVALRVGARVTASLLALAIGLVVAPAFAQTPAGEVTVSFHVTLAPSWFDPSAAPPQITPFGVLYAIHDALVRPLPGQKMGPSLAESWTESPDGLVYEFKLRRGLKFHNGDPVTADDAKWSFACAWWRRSIRSPFASISKKRGPTS